jgi:rhodanese-related sulfurtransferase
VTGGTGSAVDQARRAAAKRPGHDKTFAGDLSAAEAWGLLAEDQRAMLIDVRTDAEWTYVGGPDLSSLGKQTLPLSWQKFPTMAVNADFIATLEGQGVAKDQPLIFLCRSGARSKAAAQAMTALGYSACFNLLDGFEGPADAAKHRGGRAGWKASDLPWVQG